MSLPNPAANQNAAKESAHLVLGVAKSVMKMRVDDNVFEALNNLDKLAIEKGGRYFALSCFSELLLVEEARALAHLARGVGKDRDPIDGQKSVCPLAGRRKGAGALGVNGGIYHDARRHSSVRRRPAQALA